jgi:hypothetical protein
MVYVSFRFVYKYCINCIATLLHKVGRSSSKGNILSMKFNTWFFGVSTSDFSPGNCGTESGMVRKLEGKWEVICRYNRKKKNRRSCGREENGGEKVWR